MGEVGGGVPIGGGDDEPVEVDMRTKQRGGQCTQASPRAPSISPSRIVGDGAGAGEVDADVKVEARGRQAVGDAIPISDQAKEEDTTRASRVEPPGARSRPYPKHSSLVRSFSYLRGQQWHRKQKNKESRGTGAIRLGEQDQ